MPVLPSLAEGMEVEGDFGVLGVGCVDEDGEGGGIQGRGEKLQHSLLAVGGQVASLAGGLGVRGAYVHDREDFFLVEQKFQVDGVGRRSFEHVAEVQVKAEGEGAAEEVAHRLLRGVIGVAGGGLDDLQKGGFDARFGGAGALMKFGDGLGIRLESLGGKRRVAFRGEVGVADDVGG